MAKKSDDALDLIYDLEAPLREAALKATLLRTLLEPARPMGGDEKETACLLAAEIEALCEANRDRFRALHAAAVGEARKIAA